MNEEKDKSVFIDDNFSLLLDIFSDYVEDLNYIFDKNKIDNQDLFNILKSCLIINYNFNNNEDDEYEIE